MQPERSTTIMHRIVCERARLPSPPSKHGIFQPPNMRYHGSTAPVYMCSSRQRTVLPTPPLFPPFPGSLYTTRFSPSWLTPGKQSRNNCFVAAERAWGAYISTAATSPGWAPRPRVRFFNLIVLYAFPQDTNLYGMFYLVFNRKRKPSRCLLKCSICGGHHVQPW